MKLSNLVATSLAVSIGMASSLPISEADATTTTAVEATSISNAPVESSALSSEATEFGIPENYIKDIIVFSDDDYPVFVQNSTHHGIVILDSSVLDNAPSDETLAAREANPEAWRRWVPARGEPLYGKRELEARDADPEAWRRWVPARGEPLYGK